MQVGSRSFGNGTFNHHLVARSHKKSKGKKGLLLALNLTAMVDMFSLLVIFLLQTFSASPEMLAIAKGVTLPSASTGKEIQDAPLLALTEEGVYLDQKRMGDTGELLRNPEPLMTGLEKVRTQWLRTHPNQKFPGEINLQAHRGLSSTMVSQFMAMLPSQAFGSIQLAVVSGGSG